MVRRLNTPCFVALCRQNSTIFSPLTLWTAYPPLKPPYPPAEDEVTKNLKVFKQTSTDFTPGVKETLAADQYETPTEN
jgi:hypothetical protein